MSLFCSVVFLGSSLSAASPPAVSFDVGDVVACRDVTDPKALERIEAAEGRLLEAAFQISAFLRRGREDDLIEMVYRIECIQGGLRIVDHLPRTQLATPVVGSIAVEKKREAEAGLNLNVTGQYPPFGGGSAGGRAGGKSGWNVRYELLPPQELLSASGSIHRQRGVFFKLKPSPRSSLEGAKQFVCVFRAPAGWRGGILRVQCRAAAGGPFPLGAWGQPRRCGAAEFLVGIYAAGDEPARQAVERLVRCDEQLMSLLHQHGAQAHATASGSAVPGYGYLRQMLSPGGRRELAESLLEQQAARSEASSLPAELHRAVEELRDARREVLALRME